MDQLWFVLALVPCVLYAFTNHIDKILLGKYFQVGGVGTLMLFSSLLSFVAVPLLYFGNREVLNVRMEHIAIVGTAALLDVALLWFYLEALKDDESSVVILFYQLVPVVALAIGYPVLGETITDKQLLAMVVIIAGTSIISVKFEGSTISLRWKTVLCMVMACLCWATQSVIFKKAALEDDVWRSLFWKHVVLGAIGVFIFVCIPVYRRHFLAALKNNSGKVIGLNVLNEGLYIAGSVVAGFNVMRAQVALVLLAQTFQAIFVWLIGLALLKFFKNIAVEHDIQSHVWQKVTAILVTGVGTFILLSK